MEIWRSVRILGPVAVVLSAACAAEEPVGACEPVADGVDVVSSTGAGAWAREGRTPRFVELWRAGGTREEEELVFPVTAAVSPGGRIAIPDFQLGEVAVVEPDGTWHGTWVGRGPGPGEVRAPVAATWADDERLLVFDVAGSKIVTLEDGRPVGEDRPVARSFTGPVVAGGQLLWAGVRPSGEALLFPGWRTRTDDPAGRHYAVILRLPAGGEDPDTLVRTTFPAVHGERVGARPAPAWPVPAAAVGPGGRLAAGDATSYRIVLYDSGGSPVRQICRAAPPLPLTPEERGEGMSGEFPVFVETIRDAPAPPSPGAYGRLVVGTRRLWVQRERRPVVPATGAGLHGVPGARYDVFDVDGRYLGEARAPGNAQIQAVRGDTAWAFERGEFDEVWLVAYRIELE